MSLLDKMKKTEGQDAAAGQAGALMARMRDDQRDPASMILLCSQIIVEDQARTDLGDLQTLAASMEKQGQHNPLVVEKTDNLHVYKLRQGHRRFAAATQILGWDAIRVTIKEKADKRVQTRLEQLHENIQRKDYEPFELAYEFADIQKETGWNNRQLAEEVGVSESWVSRKLSLLKAPPEIQEAIKSGELAETDYYNDKSGTTGKATKREKPEGEGGGGQKFKTPKKLSMTWEDAAALGSLLIGFLRKEHPGQFADLTITHNSSPEEVAAFFDTAKSLWYPK